MTLFEGQVVFRSEQTLKMSGEVEHELDWPGRMYVSGKSIKLLTWVLKVDIIAVVGISQLVGHHPQGHDLLAD